MPCRGLVGIHVRSNPRSKLSSNKPEFNILHLTCFNRLADRFESNRLNRLTVNSTNVFFDNFRPEKHVVRLNFYSIQFNRLESFMKMFLRTNIFHVVLKLTVLSD